VAGEVALAQRGRLLVIGGLDSSGASSESILALDPRTGDVRDRGALVQPTHDAAGAVLGGNAFVFGGGESSSYSGGGPPFTTHTWFRFTPYAQAVRLLGLRREHGQRIADVALYDQGTPTWWRLRMDLGSMRVPRARLIAQGHFMTEHYYDFNRPMTIVPPAGHGG
jgi:hypothetical protein